MLPQSPVVEALQTQSRDTKKPTMFKLKFFLPTGVLPDRQTKPSSGKSLQRSPLSNDIDHHGIEIYERGNATAPQSIRQILSEE